MRTSRLALVVAVTVVGAGPARAGGPEVTESLGGSVNLPGVQNTVEATWTRGAFKQGFAHSVTPSYTRLGAFVQWSPAPVVELRAGVEPSLHHGTGSLLGFPSRESEFDEDTRHGRHDATMQVSGRVFLAPTLRARLGRFVASATGEAERWYATGPDPFFYEPSRDMLLARRGDTLLRASAAVLQETRGDRGRLLRVGASYRLASVRGAWEDRVARAGVVAQWTLGGRRLGLREPTLALNVFRYLADPYKKDELGLSLGLRCRLR